MGLLCLIFALLVWPVIFAGAQGTSEAWDQLRYHEAVIHTMVQQWPHLDLVNYESATTPGYHLLLSLVARFVSDSSMLLQFVNSLFSLALLLAVFIHVRRHLGPWHGLALVTPLLASSYFLGGAIWLTTDNAGWLPVALALGGSAMLTPTAGRVARWGLYCTLAVLVRQIQLWAMAPVGLAALLMSPLAGKLPRLLHRPQAGPGSWREFLLPLPLVVAPLIVVAIFARLWGGLVPPACAAPHASGINPAVIPLTLALWGMHGVFFLPAFLSGVRRRGAADVLMWGALVIAIVAALIIPTTYDLDAGRFGGLWDATRHLPTIGHCSVLFPPAAGVGALVLVWAGRAVFAAGHGRAATFLLLSMLGWLLAQMFNAEAWQRYCEPIVLIELIWMAALAMAPAGQGAPSPFRGWWIGPLLLGLAQLALSGAVLYYDAWRSVLQ